MRSLLPFLALGSSAAAYSCSGRPGVVSLDWSLDWRWLAPDGFGRPVITINNQWPPPTINACKGDRIIVQVKNNLGNETASIHYHGIYQVGTNQMDGPAMVTQCPIPPGSTFTYDFNVGQQVGTYWWHSHASGQIADGMRGPLIIHDPNPPFQADGGDLTITVSDWYHTQAPYLVDYYQSIQNANAGGAEPIPDTGLFNDGQNGTVTVQPGKTYLLHIINPGNFVGTYLKIDGHNFTIVEVDGVYTEPFEVDLLYLSVAQRYGVMLTTRESSDENFLIKMALDISMFDEVPDGYDPNFYGYLVYDKTKPLPAQVPLPENITHFDDLDLVTSQAYKTDQVAAYDHVDRQIVLNLNFTTINGITRATLNNVTNIPQLVPTLYTALTTGEDATNPLVYGVNSIPIIIEQGQIVEMIINNFDTGGHPWHLHGTTFQVFQRNGVGEGYYQGGEVTPAHPNPLRRDTVLINAGAFLAFRWKADNIGVSLMHCHIEWHVVAGLSASIMIGPDKLQKTLTIPQDHLDACHRLGIPTAGNAAANTQNPLNLTGAPTQPPQHPMGTLINATSLGDTSNNGEWWPTYRKHWAPWMPPAPSYA